MKLIYPSQKRLLENALGTFAADYGNSACQEIGEIRKNGVKHYRQHKEC
jgi:hypothetical protein